MGREARKVKRRFPVVTCLGCGKVGVFLCTHCRELNAAALKKSGNIMETVERRFAQSLR